MANFLPSRTARSAASLTIFASSAPEAPAAAFAISSKRTESAILIFFAWTLRISSRPFKSGSSTGIRLSKRPGRRSAGSRESGLLVAARITTPLEPSKPSISVSSWFRVCSRSSLPPVNPAPSRFLPIVSISSINTIHGAFSFACLKRSRTLAAPIPTNISTNSEPEMEKNGTSASPATAFARSVLPVPGGPTRRAPFGIDAPISLYFCGLWR